MFDLAPAGLGCEGSTHLLSLEIARRSTEKILFSFSSAFDCKTIPTESEFLPNRKGCQAAKQKNWTSGEKVVVERAMSFLVGNPKLEHFFRALSKNGPIQIFRSQQSTEQNGFGVLGYFSNNYPKGLVLTDLFFKSVLDWSTKCEGFMFEDPKREISRVILHELAHQFDSTMNDLSQDCSLRKVLGWVEEGETYKGVDQKEVLSQRKEGARRMKTDNSRAPAVWSMEKAQAQGFPTLYSMTEPVETLAEILTFYALDEKVATYLKPDVFNWIDRYMQTDSKPAVHCPIKEM